MDFKTLKDLFPSFCFNDKNFKRDALWLVENIALPLNEKEKQKLESNLKSLQCGKPLAYILGFVPFLNCKIFVNENTLIPRPETEQLCDILVNKFKDKKNMGILDLCCGSGAIGISLQKNLNASVLCVDISPLCLETTQKNAKENNVQIKVLQSNMFENIKGKFDLIVSNPPYIKTKEIEKLDKSVKDFEPKMALDGGDDGLNFYKIIAQNAKNYLTENGTLALEIGFDEAESIKNLLATDFKEISVLQDYFKKDRFIIAKRR